MNRTSRDRKDKLMKGRGTRRGDNEGDVTAQRRGTRGTHRGGPSITPAGNKTRSKTSKTKRTFKQPVGPFRLRIIPQYFHGSYKCLLYSSNRSFGAAVKRFSCFFYLDLKVTFNGLVFLLVFYFCSIWVRSILLVSLAFQPAAAS